MASSSDNISMAVFCDFENVALGVRDANYEKFDIKPVLERLLLKGSIVVKKAYCDWDRYKGFKSTMHEANFELIEIPHVRQSGKNSADIRLVVDALDLCYTKSHVDTFVIISGDSDFSPLVSKLRENAKHVIGVGVKQSTSDLLVANCDEFIFYDDLVREVKRAAAKRDEKRAQPASRRSPDEKSARKEEVEGRKTQALELVVEMFDALVSERGDSGKIWASLLKDTLKRRRPDFNEAYYGFRTFGNLLEEAQSRGLLEFGRDEKSGAYVYRSNGAQAALPALEQDGNGQADELSADLAQADEAPAERAPKESRRRGRGGRKPREEQVTDTIDADPVDDEEVAEQPLQAGTPVEPDSEPAEEAPTERSPKEPRRRGRGGRKPRDEAAGEPVAQAADGDQEEQEQEQEQVVAPVQAEPEAAVEAPPGKPRTPRAPRKSAARKTAAPASEVPLEDAIEQAIAEQPAAPVGAEVEADADAEAEQAQSEGGEGDVGAAPKRRSPRGRRPVKPRVPKTPT